MKRVKVAKRQAKIKVVDVYCPTVNHLHIIPIFDIQKGNPESDRESLQAMVEYIAEKENRRSAGGGDWLENHMLGSKASDMSEFTMTLHDAKEETAEDIRPIVDKIDAAVEGNHEARTSKSTGDKPVFDVLRLAGLSKEEVEARYDDSLVIVRYHVGKDSRHSRPIIYKGLFAHGWGGARTAGGQINKVEQWPLIIPNLDFYCQGHEHNLGLSGPDCVLIPDKGETVPTFKRRCINAPGFCSWSKFERGKALRIANIGACNIRLDGKRKDIHVSF